MSQPSCISYVESAVAAATEYDDQSENDDPSAVIVKKMAKAVIHKKVLHAAVAVFVSFVG